MPETDNTQVPADVINRHLAIDIGLPAGFFVTGEQHDNTSSQHEVIQRSFLFGNFLHPELNTDGFMQAVTTAHIAEELTKRGPNVLDDTLISHTTNVTDGPSNSVLITRGDDGVTVVHENSSIAGI